MSIIIYLFEFQLPMCYLNPEFLNQRDCGTIPVAEIISGKILLLLLLLLLLLRKICLNLLEIIK
jgi:hypothetical protein